MSTATLAGDRVDSTPTPTRRKAGAAGRSTRIGWAMIAPALVLMIVFLIVPILLTFGLAFTNARLISPVPAKFIGLDNFIRLFGSDTFWKSLLNTVIFAVVIVPLQAGLALGLAILVNAKMAGTNFFRTVYFLPVVTSMVVVSMLSLIHI